MHQHLDDSNDIHIKGVLSFEEVKRMRNSIKSTLLTKNTSFYYGEPDTTSSSFNEKKEVESPFQASERLQQHIPNWIKESKEKITKAGLWTDLKEDIRTRVQLATQEQIEIRREISDKMLTNGGVVQMTYSQRRRVKDLMGKCITGDQKYDRLVEEAEEMMKDNTAIPLQEVERKDENVKKEPEEVISKMLSNYPWSFMRNNLSGCLLHSFPRLVRRQLWHSAFRDEAIGSEIERYKQKKKEKEPLPKDYYPIIDKVIQNKIEQQPFIKDYSNGKLCKEVFKPVLELLLFRTEAPVMDNLSQVSDLINVNGPLNDSTIKQFVLKTVERYSNYLASIFCLMVTLYGWENVVEKYKAVDEFHFYSEKISGFLIFHIQTFHQIDPFKDRKLYYNMNLIPESIVKSFVHATEQKDTVLLNHISSIEDGVRSFLKPITRLFVSFVENNVSLFIIEQFLFTNFKPAVIGSMTSAIALILRQQILKCDTPLALQMLLKQNVASITEPDLLEVLDNNFRKYFTETHGIDIYPKEFVEISGLKGEKATLLFTQDTSSLAPPDKLSIIKAALQLETDQRDEKEMLFIWNSIWEKIDAETTFLFPYKDVNFTLVLPSKKSKMLKEISFYDVPDMVVQYSSNKLIYIDMVRRGLAEEYKQRLAQYIKDSLVYKQTDFSKEMDENPTVEIEYNYLDMPFKTKFLEEKLMTTDKEELYEILDERFKQLDSFVCGLEIQEIASQLSKTCEAKIRAKREHELKAKEQLLQKITTDLEKESFAELSKVLKEVMSGVNIFFKGTEQEQSKIDKITADEREERSYIREATGRIISTYDYNRIPKKSRQKYDKIIEKKKLSNQKNKKTGMFSRTNKK